MKKALVFLLSVVLVSVLFAGWAVAEQEPYYIGMYLSQTGTSAGVGDNQLKGAQLAVAGGYGNIYGAIIGGMFFGFLETFTAAYITTVYKDCICFGVMILVLIFMPTGLFKEQVLE